MTQTLSKEDLLRRTPVFDGCSQREIQRICRLAEVLPVRSGHPLVRQGQTGREFFLILEGRARVERDGLPVAMLGPGQFFGELSLIDGGACNATVTAEGAMEILLIGRREFSGLLDEAPALRRKLLLGLARRLRDADAPDDDGTARVAGAAG
jgi:CRP/FNR family cyclic AMP-dependent transcriptional regulator